MKGFINRMWQNLKGRVVYRIFFPFFLVVIVGVGIALPYGVITTTRLMDDRANAQLKSNLEIVESIIYRDLDKLLTFCELKIYSTPIQESINEGDIVLLRQLIIPMKIRSEVDLVVIFYRNGQEILRLDDGNLLEPNLLDLPIVTYGLAGMTYEDIVATRNGFLLGAVAPNETGQVARGINGAMFIGQLMDREFVEDIKARTGADLIISSLEGEVMASTMAEGEYGIPGIDIQPAAELLGKEHEIVLETHFLDKIPYRMAHEILYIHGNPRAIISIVMDISEIYRTERNIIGVMFFLMITGVIVQMLFSLWIARSIGQPIKELVSITERVASGDLSQHIISPSIDELGKLSDSLNIMVARLKEDIKEVREAKDRAQRYLRELKEAQAQLVQASKMAAMGQLGAGIAHELNQPLLSIGLFAEQTQLHLEGNPHLYRNLQKIIEQTNRMSAIINQIRLFSRHSHLDFEEMDINEPLKKALNLVSRQLADDDIEVELSLATDLPVVMADENQIQQVFLNIITNASDAVLPMEKKKLSISTIALEQGEFIAVDFTDTGIGISPENIDDIFVPFFTTKKDKKGLGLGLSISYGIIRSHSGMIAVGSTPGAGTRFRILLPTIKATPCWELIMCSNCIPGKTKESCPIYNRDQGYFCWIYFFREGGDERLDQQPECQECSLHQTRRRLLSLEEFSVRTC